MKKATDGISVMLLLAIIYFLLSERVQKEDRNHQLDIERRCPYCPFESSAEAANVQRSMSTHIRQMHPTEWRKLRLQNTNRHSMTD